MVENLSVALQKYVFTTQGRLNRLRYIKYQLAFGFGLGIVGAVLNFILGLIFGTESFIVTLATGATSVIGFLGGIALIIRRLHDLDRPEWWAIGVFIPIVGFVVALYLLLTPGTVGRNKYGEDPLR